MPTRNAQVTAMGITALAAMVAMPGAGRALEARVQALNGSPMLCVNGKPVSPLMFFGWASGSGPVQREIGTEWQAYGYTFVAPEDTSGEGGVHFRFGGEGPGTVWVDDVRVYPGAKTEAPAVNWARQGDFEGTREEIVREWSFFQAKYAGAEAEWALDPTTKVSGRQSLRLEIRNGGQEHMHLHWHQRGYSMKQGQTYTYTLWMKADKPRSIDFMALHIGEPWTIYGGANSLYQEQVRLARAAGVHLFSFGIDMPWPKPGEVPNFNQADQAIETTLQEDPDALLLPRFGMAPPPWWLDAHPDARMLFDDGKTEDFSVASEDWRHDLQEHLRALVRHCEQKYGDHMLGYHPCGQHTGEWFYQRSWEPRLSDFSAAMSRGFAAWTRAKYQTEGALRAAWHDPAASFAAVAVPAKEAQLRAELGWFRNPRTERRVIDFFAYKQVAMEEPLETMARVIKDETRGAKLVCFFYGYLFDMHALPMGPQESGHLAMAKLIANPDVDILCSPISYQDREQGGAGCFMSAVDSVRAAGKLWLNEDDTRTYLTPESAGFGRIDNPQGTYWVHQRNFAQLWPRRLATWYMDLGNAGWLNGKDVWDNLAPLQRFYQARIQEPARWAPEVAVIVDEVSPLYTRCGQPLLRPLVYMMRSQFQRLGAAVGIYHLSDLIAGNVPPVKALFFLNCFRLDGTQRVAVRRATQGRTAVWFYGGGFLADDASEANMAEAIGMDVKRLAPQSGKVMAAVRAGLGAGLPDTWGLEKDGGQTVTLDPAWAVSDAGATSLATFADGSVAAAAKQTPAGLRVYVGTVHCPAQLIRNVVKASGVHVYSDSDDVILTDGEFLAISATSAGPKRLVFPGVCDVLTATEGTAVARNVAELPLTLEKGETRLFMLRTAGDRPVPPPRP